MSKVERLTIALRFWRDERGQDLIEYAMIAGFLVVASTLVVPDFAHNVCLLISKLAQAWTSRG